MGPAQTPPCSRSYLSLLSSLRAWLPLQAPQHTPLPPHDYSKANFKKTETQDGNGNVAGSFTIALPDGCIQTTTYTADHTNGFIAEVTYSGEAVYPPAPAGGYPGEGHPAVAPAYHA